MASWLIFSSMGRPFAVSSSIAKGLPIEEKISQEAMAVALASPPPAPREGGFGGRDKGGPDGGGRGRRPPREDPSGARKGEPVKGAGGGHPWHGGPGPAPALPNSARSRYCR